MIKRIFTFSMIALGCVFDSNAQARQAPLSISLRLDKRSVCVGMPVQFVALVRNDSQEQIVIDRLRIAKDIYFERAFGHSPSNRSSALSDLDAVAGGYQPEAVTLHPGEIFGVYRAIKPGSEVVPAVGRYHMQVGYEQILDIPKGIWRGVVISHPVPITFRSCR